MTAPEKTLYKPGDVVGETYVLTSVLAKGGMGVVYKARHMQLDKFYALKLLKPMESSSANWRRFELEAKTLAKLEHKNVVQIFNMGVDARGCPYYVMELLHGQSMAEALERRVPLTVPQFIQSFLDVCSALKLAHSKGIVHRDIKPSNLILVDSNSPVKLTKVVDFGIARLLGVEGQSVQSLTAPGEIFGSPLYMSPEQTLGLPVTSASDIYSLGCTMYEAFTGIPPFKGQTALATMMMHQTDAMPEILREDCTGQEFEVIDQILAKCLEKQASDRFETVGEIADLLEDLMPHSYGMGRQGATSSNNLGTSPKSRNTFSRSDYLFDSNAGQTTGPVSSGDRSTIYAIAAALSIGLVTMAVLYFILTQQNQGKVVVPSNSDLTRHITGDRTLPAVDTTLRATEPFAKETKPISWLVSSGGRTWREFEFPAGEPVGFICLSGTKKIPASGRMKSKHANPVVFDATDVLADAPQFYDRFDNKAVCSLQVKDSNIPPSISTLARWKNLSAFAIEHCNLDDSYLRGFSRLKHLESLSLLHCDVSAQPLIDSGVLFRINALQLVHVRESARILKAIENRESIRSLSIRHIDLNEQELASIAALPRLVHLDLRTTRLPASAMATVARLPNLRWLHLSEATFDAATLTSLVKCKKLESITLDKNVLSAQQNLQLKAKLPSLVIIEELD
jgi:serine/threonine-protein kinase